MFVGANGSGKSNLLEAIGVLGAAASGRVDDESLLRRGVRPGLPALYKTSFHGGKTLGHIALSAQDGAATYRVALLNPLENPKPSWEYKTELLQVGPKKYVLFSLILAQHPGTPPAFAVDNFDHGLNPRLARGLTSQFCEWLLQRGDRQALLTSHNPLVLDGLPLRDDRVRLFAVDRSYLGRTQVRRVVVDSRMSDAADNGIPLSPQWVMGHIGGVPDV